MSLMGTLTLYFYLNYLAYETMIFLLQEPINFIDKAIAN
jgi:hypothetical protein